MYSIISFDLFPSVIAMFAWSLDEIVKSATGLLIFQFYVEKSMRWSSFLAMCGNFFNEVVNNNKMLGDIKVSLLSVVKCNNFDKKLKESELENGYVESNNLFRCLLLYLYVV
mgnify:FL=1